MPTSRHPNGFTLLELIVVIAVIGVLSSMALFGYRDISKKAKADTEMAQIVKAARNARIKKDAVLKDITGTSRNCSECPCRTAGYNSATCKTALDPVYNAMEIPGGAMMDPWGYYYGINENELEIDTPQDRCIQDEIYSKGANKSVKIPVYSTTCNGSP